MTSIDIGNAAQVTSAVISFCSLVAVIWIATRQSAAVRQAAAAAAEAKTAALVMEKAARWHETEIGIAVIAKVDKNATRLDIVKERLIHVATCEDVARLSGQIDSVARASNQAAAGVDRLEAFFLAEGVRGGR
jgi:prephenate dehydratase